MMKYLYKQTGTVVESEVPLDSAIFTPVKEEEQAAKKKTAKKPVQKSAEKTAEK